MVHADDVRASIKVCMFDQYGTVVDMQTGLTEAAAPFLAAKGWQGDPNSFVTWWRRTHFENSMIDALLHRKHTSYREVGHRSVASVLERAGISYTLDEVHDLVGHIERCDRFQRCPKRSLDYKRVIRWWFSPMAIRTCWKQRSATTEFPSTVLSRSRLPMPFKPHVATYTKAA